MFDYGLILFICLTMAIVCAKIFIPILHKLKFGQTVREEGPKNHVKKNGTPTMGGVIFIVPIIIGSFLYLDFNIKQLYPMLALIVFASIGFVDDFLKIKRGKNLGLTALQKIILLFIGSLGLAIVGKSAFGSNIYIPFIKSSVDLGLLYIPFMMFVFIGASNAVNLTDGLDGLATSVTITALVFLGIITNMLKLDNSVVFIVLTIGALIGFLLFNLNPAKVFMGDTGSLALGGLLVGITTQMGLQLILILIGIIYIIETLSVIVQVFWFKRTGKRIFKMSPIHHHYEMCGLSENKIVILFSLVTVVFGVISIFGI